MIERQVWWSLSGLSACGEIEAGGWRRPRAFRSAEQRRRHQALVVPKVVEAALELDRALVAEIAHERADRLHRDQLGQHDPVIRLAELRHGSGQGAQNIRIDVATPGFEVLLVLVARIGGDRGELQAVLAE